MRSLLPPHLSSTAIAREPINNRISVPIAPTRQLLVSNPDRHEVIRASEVIVLIILVDTPIYKLLVRSIHLILYFAPILFGLCDLGVESLALVLELLALFMAAIGTPAVPMPVVPGCSLCYLFV